MKFDPKLIAIILILLIVSWSLISGARGCNSGDHGLYIENKVSILNLEDYYLQFRKLHGRYPKNFDELRRDSDIRPDETHFKDTWGSNLIVIFPENYEFNNLAQKFTLNGNRQFYHPNKFQVLVVHPESGAVHGNFPRRKD